MGNKQQKTVHINAGFLFDDVDSVIKSLQEIKKNNPEALQIYTEEHWTGYEDVEFRVCVVRWETDKELSDREEREEYERKQKEKDRIERQREHNKRMKELDAKHKAEREKYDREFHS